MSVAHHLKPGLGEKTRVRILTVDIPQRRVEAVLKDGSMIHIAVWEVPNAFRWPIENEIWLVRRDSGIWMLDKRVQQEKDQTRQPITAMLPGEMKLDADIVVDAAGRTFVAVDLTGIQDGWTIRWDSTLKRFLPGP